MLKPQFLNYVDNSFALWLENWVLSKGSGVQSVSSNLYPIGQQFGKFVYAAPYQPFIADESIMPNSCPTGVYLSGSFVKRGESGFLDYNYKKGWAYFSHYVGGAEKVSGNYTVSDINILPIDISEDKLLFETKFELRKPNTTLSGLKSNTYTYPAIYIKAGQSFNNEPYALGGEQLSKINIGLFIIADSAYQLSCLKSIIGDAKEQIIPLLTTSPYNIYGGFSNTGQNYNYASYSSGAKYYSGMFIEDITVTTLNRQYWGDFTKLNPDVYHAIADITLCRNRFSRSNTNNL